MEYLGPFTRMHKDCVEIQQLLEKNHRVYKSHLEDPKSIFKIDTLRNVRSALQTKLRQMQDTWLSKKADEIQQFSDRNNMKRFYQWRIKRKSKQITTAHSRIYLHFKIPSKQLHW